LDSVL